MPPARIHLIRHGQGQHQLPPTEKNQYLPDPVLTEEGIAACKAFRKNHPPSTLNPDLICASPLRRTIQTAKFCFGDRFDSHDTSNANGTNGTSNNDEKKQEKILLHPYAQEATDLPSDTGSEQAVLEGEFGDLVDLELLAGEQGEQGWRSSSGIYSPSHEALRARAKAMREWLAGREEREVVVVGHGQFWHWVTGEVDGEGMQTSKFSFSSMTDFFLRLAIGILLTIFLSVLAPFWDNAEWRSYTLEVAEDGEVQLVEETESLQRRGLPN
jgi:broad specificity phosphatase PhoE